MTLPTFYLRRATTQDEPFLWEMLCVSIFVPEGAAPPSRSILREPAIARYVTGWRRSSDEGVIAVESETGDSIGAAWFRLFSEAEPGYGFIDAATPELVIAVAPDHRNQGVGTEMLEQLLAIARARYEAISVSCDPANPAKRLYLRAGFRKSGSDGTMRLAL